MLYRGRCDRPCFRCKGSNQPCAAQRQRHCHHRYRIPSVYRRRADGTDSRHQGCSESGRDPPCHRCNDYQEAVTTAKTFNDRLEIDGVILTKLDGDTRGGAALSVRAVVDKPIKFIGTGEKMEAFDVFHPERMADRILGMGDVVSLVERAQQQFDEEEAKRLEKKIRKNKFDFNDFLGQIQQVKKMGNVKDLAAMIPGVGKAIKDIEIPDDPFKNIEAIIGSMTPKERENPDIINQSRRQRIAKGSGTDIQEVNRLIKQFDQTRKMMKMVTGMGPGKMMAMANAMKNLRR